MSSRSEAPPRAPTERDWRRLSAAGPIEEFAAAWLAIAGAFLGADRGVLVTRRPDSERFSPVAFLPEGEPCGGFLADAAERALYEGGPLTVQDGARLGVAYPVDSRGRLEAIAAFEWENAPEPVGEALLRRIKWGLPWIEARLGRGTGNARVAQEFRAADALRRTLEAKTFRDAARAAATELAHAFSCERAAVGFVEAGAVKLAAISHTAQFDPRLALPVALAAAMDEAVRAGGAAVHPAEGNDGGPLGRLAAEHGAGAVLCRSSGGIAFCLERKAPFDGPAQQEIEAACALLAPALALQHADELPLHRRAARTLRVRLQAWIGPVAGRRRVVAAAVLLAAVFLVFAKGEFRATGNAALEGAVRRMLVAPFDGFVAASNSRAGDLVKQGGQIAALDDRELRLERVRWASQHAQYARQIQEASARHERGQVQILQAQLAQAEAQVQLLDEQIKRARLVAPFDGLVVSGDLSQSVGGVVKKGDTLFEVAPLSGYRVVVQVDESDIAAVAAGQKGTLLLAAITERTFPITVTAVTPVARASDGRNAFRVEAALDDSSERLRPGMEGVAKIETGPRNLAWIWTYRFTNWVRLKLWSLWP